MTETMQEISCPGNGIAARVLRNSPGLYAGAGAGLINEILPASSIVEDLVGKISPPSA